MHMRCMAPYRSVIALTMVIVMLMASLPVNLAHAAMVTTDQVIEQSTSVDDRTRILAIMAREDVRRELGTLGIDPDEAARRVASLSDDEIRQIAGRLDQLPAGQGSDTGLVVGLVVLEILYILVIVAIIAGVSWLVVKFLKWSFDSSSEKDQIDGAARASPAAVPRSHTNGP